MKHSLQLVFASLPAGRIVTYNVDFEPRSFSRDTQQAASQPKVALHRFKNSLIHAQLGHDGTSLQIRRFDLDSTLDAPRATENEQQPAIRIHYSSPIASDIVLVNGDRALYCWIVSIDGHLIRHRLDLERLFSATATSDPRPSSDLGTVVRPIQSFANNRLVSLSVATSGVATMTFDDGALIHVQDLEQHSAPATNDGLDVIYRDDAICEYQIRELSTFAPFVLLRRASKLMGWKTTAAVGGPGGQAFVTALASSDNVTVGMLQDHQLSVWKWKDGGSRVDQELFELPQFDENQRLVDAAEQDLTCQIPGSFDPPPLNTHDQEPPLSNDIESHTHDYRVRMSSCGSLAIIFVDAKGAPYFAIYDIASARFLRVVMATCADGERQLIQFVGSLKGGSLQLWAAWQQHQNRVALTTVDVPVPSHSMDDLVLRTDWLEMCSCTVSSAAVDMLMLGDTQLMMATSDSVAAARNLDSMDTAFSQNVSMEDTGCDSVLSTLSAISAKLDTDKHLESQLRSCFPRGSPEDLYRQEHGLKDVDTSNASTPTKKDIGKLLSLMVPDEQPAEQHPGTLIQTLVVSATSQIVATRFQIAFALLTLLTHAVYGDGDTSLTELMLSTWELLRTLDALRWLESQGNDMRQVYPVVLKGWDIGSAAYHRVATLAKPDMLIEIADMLAVQQGDMAGAIALTRLFLDNNQLTMAEGGKKGDTVRAVQCRGYLADKDFEHAADVLQQVTDPSVQERLLDDLLDHAYASAKYETICKRLQPLGVTRVGDCIRQRAEKHTSDRTGVQAASSDDRLTWWQIGYSFYTLAGQTEQANACMRQHLEETGNEDELLTQFFSVK